MAAITVSFGGRSETLEICRTEEEAASLTARWSGAVRIEDIFQMKSSSSHRARVHLANRVLRAFGESLVLDVNKHPDELTEALHRCSAGAKKRKKKI